jgi:RNA polymerase sigma-70 factor (ECF subfamily)
MDQHDQFLTLFLRFQADLRAFIGSVVRERSVRDDLLQETALVLWREFERYDSRRSFGAWARGIAANKLMQWLEREKRHTCLPIEAVPAVVAAFDRAEEAVEARREALQQCLNGLPPRSQTLLELRYQQGHSLAEVADHVQSTMDAVHKALSRIRARLQECIERRLRQSAQP